MVGLNVVGCLVGEFTGVFVGLFVRGCDGDFEGLRVRVFEGRRVGAVLGAGGVVGDFVGDRV